MSQQYSDPSRATDLYALPNVEVFEVTSADARANRLQADENFDNTLWLVVAGWYYWYCFPGCLPDSDPIGPFETEAEAVADMREQEQ